MTMIEEAACVGPSGGCVAPYNSPGSNDPGGDNNTGGTPSDGDEEPLRHANASIHANP